MMKRSGILAVLALAAFALAGCAKNPPKPDTDDLHILAGEALRVAETEVPPALELGKQGMNCGWTSLAQWKGCEPDLQLARARIVRARATEIIRAWRKPQVFYCVSSRRPAYVIFSIDEIDFCEGEDASAAFSIELVD